MSTPQVAGELNSGAYRSVTGTHSHGAQIKDQIFKKLFIIVAQQKMWFSLAPRKLFFFF